MNNNSQQPHLSLEQPRQDQQPTSNEDTNLGQPHSSRPSRLTVEEIFSRTSSLAATPSEQSRRSQSSASLMSVQEIFSRRPSRPPPGLRE
jgi:hypothetical protein